MENKYTKEEVHNATLEYFDGDELATNVWTSKYALRDLEDNYYDCLLYTSPSPRDSDSSRMPSSA